MIVGVVTRRLVLSPGMHYDPVISAVFEEPTDPDVDDPIGYFESRMADHAKEFSEKFAEFKNAEWSLTIIGTLK